MSTGDRAQPCRGFRRHRRESRALASVPGARHARCVLPGDERGYPLQRVIHALNGEGAPPGCGLLVYPSIDSTGYRAQPGRWPLVALIALVPIVSRPASTRLLGLTADRSPR